MKLTKKMKDYSPLIVPLSKPIEELTIAEAKKYNEWFVQNIDSRVDYLITKVAVHFGLQKTDLIYTTDSLFYIWKWFLEIGEISKTKKNILRDLRKNLLGQPKSFINHIINQNKTEFSIYTQYVLRDIGMYLGAMIRENFPQIKWSYKTSPKNYVDVNHPILIGFIDDNPEYPKPFYPDFEPIEAVECLALNLFDGTQNQEDLINLYNSLLSWIP